MNTKEIKEQAHKEFDYWCLPKGLGYTNVHARDKQGNMVIAQEVDIDSLIDKAVQHCRQNHRQDS